MNPEFYSESTRTEATLTSHSRGRYGKLLRVHPQSHKEIHMAGRRHIHCPLSLKQALNSCSLNAVTSKSSDPVSRLHEEGGLSKCNYAVLHV